MKNVVQFPDNSAIEEAAGVWLARLDGGNLSASRKQELQAWLEADPRHREVLQRMAGLWGEMDALGVLAELFPLQMTRRSAEKPQLQTPLAWWREHRFGAAPAFAASAALVLGVVFVLNSPLGPDPGAATAGPVELVYQTELGKQSRTTLKDGSTMTLNTETRARVRFDDNERAIYLEQGEAFFEVAKNTQRPFIVYAGNGRVRAVGTAFSVRVRDQDVDVAVTQGIVEVAADNNTRTAKLINSSPVHQRLHTITLKARGVANYSQSIEAHTYIELEKIEHKLAWTNGKWIFEGDELADVIAEANRYTSRKIEITDPAIARMKIGGYFNVGEVDSLLATLEQGFGIKITHVSGDLIQLSAQDGASIHTR